MSRINSISCISRVVCATSALLGLGAICGVVIAPPAYASGTTATTLNSVTAPQQFTAGQNLPVTIGLSGGSAQVHITSLPAGIVDYTVVATDGNTINVPTNPISGAQPGDHVATKLVVTYAEQSLQTDTTANAGEFEPIFPSPASSSKGEFEPIFPAPAPSPQGEFEPIFPSPVASPQGEFEPIFPAPIARPQGEFEPIFPAPIATPSGEFEPIFPKASASRFYRFTHGRLISSRN